LREFIILLISFTVAGIRFMFGKVLGIASVRYFVASSVKIVVSLFIFSIIVKKWILKEFAKSLGFYIAL
jgi:hypothetical protein